VMIGMRLLKLSSGISIPLRSRSSSSNHSTSFVPLSSCDIIMAISSRCLRATTLSPVAFCIDGAGFFYAEQNISSTLPLRRNICCRHYRFDQATQIEPMDNTDRRVELRKI
jgi:hypothetical protein